MDSSVYHDNQPRMFGLVERIARRSRERMFARLMDLVRPTRDSRVLDVGVTCDRKPDSNFFEKMYPHPDRVVAAGLEDASFLEQECPGVKFVKIGPGSLPFKDGEFDLIVSFAVIEHVGSRENQRKFLAELFRVGKRVYITTPNRGFPVEFHTVTPFLHWLPQAWFRKIIAFFGNTFYSTEENLNLLRERELLSLFPEGVRVTKAHHRLLGWVSNLVVLGERA